MRVLTQELIDLIIDRFDPVELVDLMNVETEDIIEAMPEHIERSLEIIKEQGGF